MKSSLDRTNNAVNIGSDEFQNKDKQFLMSAELIAEQIFILTSLTRILFFMNDICGFAFSIGKDMTKNEPAISLVFNIQN